MKLVNWLMAEGGDLGRGGGETFMVIRELDVAGRDLAHGKEGDLRRG